MTVNTKRIDYSNKFDKHLRKAPLVIKIAFRQRLELFLKDPFNPLLRNHQLSGKLKHLRSINVTGDWRALYSEHSEVIIFELLGTHSRLYK